MSAWCALACEPEHRQYQGGPTPEMAAWFVVCRKHGVLRMRRYGQTVWSTHTIPTRREPDLAEIYRR